jgi:hypothetical protein
MHIFIEEHDYPTLQVIVRRLDLEPPKSSVLHVVLNSRLWT